MFIERAQTVGECEGDDTLRNECGWRPLKEEASGVDELFHREPLAQPFPPSFPAHKHAMADEEPGASQHEQPKMEEANAPINIKVREGSVVIPCRAARVPPGISRQPVRWRAVLACGGHRDKVKLTKYHRCVSARAGRHPDGRGSVLQD